MSTERKHTDYKAISFWGRNLGSFHYYIEAEQRRALADNAPLNAIYKGADGQWQTLNDVQNMDIIKQAIAEGLM